MIVIIFYKKLQMETNPLISRIGKILFITLMIIFALGTLYKWLALTWSYSKGERAGYVQKLSEKGWLCKTWEGEISLLSMPGTISEKFYFSVPDASIAEKLNQSVGKKVALVYEQHIGLPSSCFGETEYFVIDVRTL